MAFSVEKVSEALAIVSAGDNEDAKQMAQSYLNSVHSSIHGWQLADNCLQVRVDYPIALL